jgi:hypothetical protein
LARSDQALSRSACGRESQMLAPHSWLKTVVSGFDPTGAGRGARLPKAMSARHSIENRDPGKSGARAEACLFLAWRPLLAFGFPLAGLPLFRRRRSLSSRALQEDSSCTRAVCVATSRGRPRVRSS